MNEIENIQIHLNSEIADKVYENSSHVDFYLPTIEIPYKYHIYASVQHMSIPYTFYNINSTNNVLYYTVNSVSKSLTITPGNYNVNSLKSFLNTNMTGFTVSYSAIQNSYTFVNSNYNFVFLSTSTCLSILGFSSQNNSSYLLSMTSNIAVNLATIRCICIQTNLQTSNINKANVNNYSVLCSIPVDVAPYSIITYRNINNFKVNTFTNVISLLTIKLTDQFGQLIDLNGSNWSMTLQFNIIDFTE